ncbi:hypothetical protein LOK49_LG03G02560 [Camellia lanceoleosa]|uniref:Uncharacterized protein n=1 Tax=Camellia lanceoleosa TaxID=1840588 RepID=A0ACC0IIY9_9ERIC|nr:hypothetical protein LOK49_LG03G02560 [Camellia lanceoleosa]
MYNNSGKLQFTYNEFVLGDLIWVRLCGSLWWPAQVVDDNTVSQRDKPINRSVGKVHVMAEMAPIAKVGDLSDVVTGLARVCVLRGHKVDIMIPFYECIPKQ